MIDFTELPTPQPGVMSLEWDGHCRCRPAPIGTIFKSEMVAYCKDCEGWYRVDSPLEQAQENLRLAKQRLALAKQSYRRSLIALVIACVALGVALVAWVVVR